MKRLFFTVCVAALVGCGGGSDDSSTAATPNNLDKFVGAWKVTYTGGDRGDCTLNVPVPTSVISATLTGTCKSSVIGVTFAVNGTINNIGSVTAGQLVGDGFYLSGSMTGSSGSGTWRTQAGSATASGNWTATR